MEKEVGTQCFLEDIGCTDKDTGVYICISTQMLASIYTRIIQICIECGMFISVDICRRVVFGACISMNKCKK